MEKIDWADEKAMDNSTGQTANKPDILIVDDRAENLVALEALLEDCAATVHKASSGNEALSLMLKQEYALVLLDVQMPEMDGFEVAELMRRHERTAHIPIIFVTAISKEQRYVFKGYEVGAVDYLFKPLDPVILRGKVNIFLDLWRQKNLLVAALAEKERLEKKLKQQAEFDLLTQLPNRVLFQDRLQQAILMCERSEVPGALMFIDLDRFKFVNDTMGHEAGDQLLIQAANRIGACIRKSDTVARFGGDEFTVILQNVYHESLAELVARKILNELANPFDLLGKAVHISGSVGISIFPNDSIDTEELLKNADTAMYQAKNSGRNAFRFFVQDMNIYANERMTLEEQLRASFDNDSFILHYQPKVDLFSGKILGIEALVRWEKPGVGLVFPDEFIPLVEEIGLIDKLGQWVLETACRQNRKWNVNGFPNLRVSVNISAKQFNGRNSLIKIVKKILDATGLVPENLELEITESTVMENVDIGLETLEELKAMGVNIAVDDFGTGYSSLSTLKQFPIQTLKIDKTFVRDMTHDSDDSAIVSAIISMANKLSMSVIAEGVETLEQLEVLKKDGCDEIQGYYFSSPLPLEECTKMLEANKLQTHIN